MDIHTTHKGVLYGVSAFGIVINLLLAYLIVSCKKPELKFYGRALLHSCFLDVLLAALFSVVLLVSFFYKDLRLNVDLF